MTSRDFCYWLQGFFEINGIQYNVSQNLTAEQITCIRNHLNMVFRHEIDPSFGDKQHVEELTKIHQGETLPDGATVTISKTLADMLPEAWRHDLSPKINC